MWVNKMFCFCYKPPSVFSSSSYFQFIIQTIHLTKFTFHYSLLTIHLKNSSFFSFLLSKCKITAFLSFCFCLFLILKWTILRLLKQILYFNINYFCNYLFV